MVGGGGEEKAEGTHDIFLAWKKGRWRLRPRVRERMAAITVRERKGTNERGVRRTV